MKKKRVVLFGSLLLTSIVWFSCEKDVEYSNEEMTQENPSKSFRTVGDSPVESMALATYQTQVELNALDEGSWDNYFSIYLNPDLTDDDKFVLLDADPAYDNLLSSMSDQLTIMMENPTMFDSEENIDMYSDLVGDLYNDHAPFGADCNSFMNAVDDERKTYAACVIVAAALAPTFGAGLVAIAGCWAFYTINMNALMRDNPGCIHLLEGIWTDIRILSLEAQEFHESGGTE